MKVNYKHCLIHVYPTVLILPFCICGLNEETEPFQYSRIWARAESGVGINVYFAVTFHYNDVIISTMTSQLIGVSIICLIVGSGADKRKKIKAPLQWPLCGEFTGDRWILHTKHQWRGNVSIWWRPHEILVATPFSEVTVVFPLWIQINFPLAAESHFCNHVYDRNARELWQIPIFLCTGFLKCQCRFCSFKCVYDD